MFLNPLNSSQMTLQQMLLLSNPSLLNNSLQQLYLQNSWCNGLNYNNQSYQNESALIQQQAMSLEFLQKQILQFNLDQLVTSNQFSEVNLNQIQNSVPVIKKGISKSQKKQIQRAKFSAYSKIDGKSIQLISTIGQNSSSIPLDSFNMQNYSQQDDSISSSSSMTGQESKHPSYFISAKSKLEGVFSSNELALTNKISNDHMVEHFSQACNKVQISQDSSSDYEKSIFLNLANQVSKKSYSKDEVSTFQNGQEVTNESAAKSPLNLQPKSESFLQQFDFSDVRQNQCKNKKVARERKPNSSYVKNSQYHNLNKLFMYNILSMFRADALENLNIPQEMSKELIKIILKLKMSSRRDYQNPQRGFFDYFSHGHYKVLFLQINAANIQSIRESQVELDLHKQCFNIDLSKNISEIELNYLNTIKEINFNIFMVNIREEQLFDDGSSSKQNIRRKYTLKVINGIKKLAKGQPIKRF